MSPAIARLRAVGIAEGVSFLVLLGIAVPLKHVWGHPEAVRWCGSVHGGLFLLYLIALTAAANRHAWGFGRVGRLLLAAVLPFGTFVADRGLRAEQRAPA